MGSDASMAADGTEDMGPARQVVRWEAVFLGPAVGIGEQCL